MENTFTLLQTLFLDFSYPKTCNPEVRVFLTLPGVGNNGILLTFEMNSGFKVNQGNILYMLSGTDLNEDLSRQKPNAQVNLDTTDFIKIRQTLYHDCDKFINEMKPLYEHFIDTLHKRRHDYIQDTKEVELARFDRFCDNFKTDIINLIEYQFSFDNKNLLNNDDKLPLFYQICDYWKSLYLSQKLNSDLDSQKSNHFYKI